MTEKVNEIHLCNTLDHIFVMEADVVRAMAKLGSPRSQSRKLYKAMQEYYLQELASKGLINPGTKGVPKAVAEKYLSLYGIDL